MRRLNDRRPASAPTALGATQLRRWVGIFLVLGLLSGCGGKSGSDRADARADEAGVRNVLAEALDALYDGDGARACSLYTSSYRRALVKENQADRREVTPKGATCEEQVKEFAPMIRRFVPDRDVKVISVIVREDKATAVSELNTTRGKMKLTEFLVRQDGKWKIDGDQEEGEAAPTGRREFSEDRAARD